MLRQKQDHEDSSDSIINGQYLYTHLTGNMFTAISASCCIKVLLGSQSRAVDRCQARAGHCSARAGHCSARAGHCSAAARQDNVTKVTQYAILYLRRTQYIYAEGRILTGYCVDLNLVGIRTTRTSQNIGIVQIR